MFKLYVSQAMNNIDMSTKCLISRSHYMFINCLSCWGLEGVMAELEVKRLPSQWVQFELAFPAMFVGTKYLCF